MSKPLVSVIIPCYNAERFLEQTINSVLVQTLPNWEIIIVDDGSTDKSAEIINSFGDKVRALFGSNQGVSVARNSGTKLAQGQYIQYLDADDLLRPDALERRVLALERSGADVVYSNWQRLIETEDGSFTAGGIVDRSIEAIHPNPEIALFTDFWAPPAALLYRRATVEAIGGWNESLPIIQDARFLLDAAFVGSKFVYVPEVGADYRVHRHSLSRRNALAFMQDCYRNTSQVEEIWRRNGGITQERCIALVQSYGQIARFFFEHDDDQFEEVVKKIYQLDPNYLPSGPKVLRILSRYAGYRQAEFIALQYRKMKALTRNKK